MQYIVRCSVIDFIYFGLVIFPLCGFSLLHKKNQDGD
jgi:hypothetical protein